MKRLFKYFCINADTVLCSLKNFSAPISEYNKTCTTCENRFGDIRKKDDECIFCEVILSTQNGPVLKDDKKGFEIICTKCKTKYRVHD
jgi:hypothetical protein